MPDPQRMPTVEQTDDLEASASMAPPTESATSGMWRGSQQRSLSQESTSEDGRVSLPSSSPISPISHDGHHQHHRYHGTPKEAGMIKYGELIVLGYNGILPQGDKGRRRSKFILYKRKLANGVKPSRQHIVQKPQNAKAVMDSKQHSVSYTLNRTQAVVVEYTSDEETDMFQIGRSSETPIDFVVMDTIPGDKQADSIITQSTISRFACRVTCDRSVPDRSRVYAAGFDSSRNIFLGEKATKWQKSDEGGEIDGLTTNGILIMHPKGKFFGGRAEPGIWREVSVCGSVYALRESRSAPQKGALVEDESNVLLDGTLVDLCGATLLWRSAASLSLSPTKRYLEHQVEELNAGRPQCPVGLNTLVIQKKNTLVESDKQPYVYLSCGHVQGEHSWGREDETRRRCPMCQQVGPVVKLQMGIEPAFYVDTNIPTHCFNPCGHMASEQTVKYWASVPLPYGCHGFRAACPFCAIPLISDTGWQKLIFQDYVD